MVDLTSYNTLHLPSKAANFMEINSPKDINGLDPENLLFLGSGTNILFKNNFPGTICLIKLKPKKRIFETEDSVTIELGAGESWHNFVTWAINHNLSGIENMALIPGTVGAAAIGNIAAYGQNQEDVFIKLTAFNLKSKHTEEFTKKVMQFGYRDSIFKKNLDSYLVTSVTYQLSKTSHLELSYHAARHASLLPTLQSMAKEPYTIQNVFDAVIRLRTEKLPDPKKIGTAGSFFKNPLVSKNHYLKLKSQISGFQGYPPEKLKYSEESEWLDSVESVKIPAGRLLDELGWKGKRIGNVGTFAQHALTIVTYPGATGPEVYEFAENMRADIQKNFYIDLEYEVVIV